MNSLHPATTGTPWTDDEKAIMRDRYATASLAELRAALPGRNDKMIYSKAHNMGLRKVPVEVPGMLTMIAGLLSFDMELPAVGRTMTSRKRRKRQRISGTVTQAAQTLIHKHERFSHLDYTIFLTVRSRANQGE